MFVGTDGSHGALRSHEGDRGECAGLGKSVNTLAYLNVYAPVLDLVAKIIKVDNLLW